MERIEEAAPRKYFSIVGTRIETPWVSDTLAENVSVQLVEHGVNIDPLCSFCEVSEPAERCLYAGPNC